MWNYKLRTSKKSGKATLFFQLRSKKHSINMPFVNSGIDVDIISWRQANTPKKMAEYLKTDEGKKVAEQMSKVEGVIKLLLEGDMVTPDDVRAAINEIKINKLKKEYAIKIEIPLLEIPYTVNKYNEVVKILKDIGI